MKRTHPKTRTILLILVVLGAIMAPTATHARTERFTYDAVWPWPDGPGIGNQVLNLPYLPPPPYETPAGKVAPFPEFTVVPQGRTIMVNIDDAGVPDGKTVLVSVNRWDPSGRETCVTVRQDHAVRGLTPGQPVEITIGMVQMLWEKLVKIPPCTAVASVGRVTFRGLA